MNQQHIITATQNWLTTFIIAYEICPFARQVHEQNQIRYRVLDFDTVELCLGALLEECHHLDAEPTTETTLLIFDGLCRDFDDFLDVTALAEQLLFDMGYEGVYQLASFHPDYCFTETETDDAANYTNRSPYPMLHIIREASIEQALKHYPEPELIPERNMALCRKLGAATIRALLTAHN